MIENAVIVDTFIGPEGHGIPTCQITLEFSNNTQAFGGYDLRVYGIDFVTRILSVIGTNSWENLKGRNVRVDREDHKIIGIGHIVESKWFYPEKERNDDGES